MKEEREVGRGGEEGKGGGSRAGGKVRPKKCEGTKE